jgi:hypothetical protein
MKVLIEGGGVNEQCAHFRGEAYEHTLPHSWGGRSNERIGTMVQTYTVRYGSNNIPWLCHPGTHALYQQAPPSLQTMSDAAACNAAHFAYSDSLVGEET